MTVLLFTFLAILGASAKRMMFFWTPYICVFAACAVANDDFWNMILPGKPVRKVLRSVLTMIVIAAVVKNNKARLSEELEDLREFYDPDTVDLMVRGKICNKKCVCFS